MATVGTATQNSLWDSFSVSKEDIQEGLSVGRATAADGHWTKCAHFCARVALDPLPVAYKDHVPILKAFDKDYRTGNISPNIRAVKSRAVEDVVRSIGQAIAALGAKDPRIMSKGKIYGRLKLQFRCYSRQDPPPSRVKHIPVQVL